MLDESWQSRGRGRGRGRGAGPFNLGKQGSNTNANFHQVDRSARPSSSTAGLTKRMDLIASVSRSSGVEKDGDELVASISYD